MVELVLARSKWPSDGCPASARRIRMSVLINATGETSPAARTWFRNPSQTAAQGSMHAAHFLSAIQGAGVVAHLEHTVAGSSPQQTLNRAMFHVKRGDVWLDVVILGERLKGIDPEPQTAAMDRVAGNQNHPLGSQGSAPRNATDVCSRDRRGRATLDSRCHAGHRTSSGRRPRTAPGPCIPTRNVMGGAITPTSATCSKCLPTDARRVVCGLTSAALQRDLVIASTPDDTVQLRDLSPPTQSAWRIGALGSGKPHLRRPQQSPHCQFVEPRLV